MLVSCRESNDASTADLEAAARSYIEAVNAADGEAIWMFMTDRCRAATSIDEVIANEATAELNAFGSIESLSVEVNGDRGTVQVRTTKGGADLVRDWVTNGGQWRVTGCPYT